MTIISSISFVGTANSTSLVGYFYELKSFRQYRLNMDNYWYSNKDQEILDTYGFDKLRSALIKLAKNNCHAEKSTFFITCLFEDTVFTLYDYKDDESIHVGGMQDRKTKDLLPKFMKELENLLLDELTKHSY